MRKTLLSRLERLDCEIARIQCDLMDSEGQIAPEASALWSMLAEMSHLLYTKRMTDALHEYGVSSAETTDYVVSGLI